ncbi:hypothetical protein YSY22_03000 [Brevibacillus formosus]
MEVLGHIMDTERIMSYLYPSNYEKEIVTDLRQSVIATFEGGKDSIQ